MRKSVVTVLLLASITGGGFYYLQHGTQAKRPPDNPDTQKTKDEEAAMAVSELPQGVEDAWLTYVDKRVPALIQREGKALRVHDNIQSLVGGSVIVSLTTPYQISCDLMGGHIKFGSGDDAPNVTVFWMIPEDLAKPDDATPKGNVPESTISFGKDEPALMVDYNSVAAMKLRERLCSQISEKLQGILEAPK